ncbi:hypothetical protein Tco_0002097 [Tanacetum coccineum]
MLKKFGLEDSKPTKTPMSTEIKLTKDDEADSVDSSKYRGMIGSLLYLTAITLIAKSTSGVCMIMGCCLTSWFAKKQTALAISTTDAEYISARKACQQALWMKQALIDYDIRLNDVLIMCDNKGAIDLSKNPVQHSRTKHIEIRHHFLRDNIQKGNISIEKVASEDNIADIFTKPLKREEKALEALKTLKPKVKGIVFQESSTTTTKTTISSQQSHDKGKGIMIEHVKPMKKKDQISFDEEIAKKLQAEFDVEERLV